MEDFNWIKESQIKQQKEIKEEKRKTKEVKPQKEKVSKNQSETSLTVIRLEGEPFDPFEKFAVLALVDIAPKVKRLRNIPQFFHIKRPETIIGTKRKAHIKLDDIETIKAEHACIVFKAGQFHIHPQHGAVKLNGKMVFDAKKGEVLRNGSQIEIGSAKFIFLTNLDVKNEETITL